ncbi:MAG TPA: hypothetical protein VFF73_24840 [Planctomycetota bacterium]|nr:hypothetical protein [Planctomycetota bacterium]
MRRDRKSFFLVTLAFAVGCSSGTSKPDKDNRREEDPIIGPFVGDDLYANIDFKIKIADDDVHFQGEKDYSAELVARWAKERGEIIKWCLNQNEQRTNEFGKPEHSYKLVWPNRPETRLQQAIAIESKVVEKIPDFSRMRYELAWCLFTQGAGYFWAIDACMNRINVLKAEVGDDENNPDPKCAKQVAKIKELRRLVDGDPPNQDPNALKKKMIAYHTMALQHFAAYYRAIPMDKSVPDFLFKIHFQLGNWKECLKFLNQVIDEGTLSAEEQTQYESIRTEINNYLVDREINKNAAKPNASWRDKDIQQTAPREGG